MDGLEILEYKGEGYKPLVRFGGWRVAVIRYSENFDEKNYYRVERHHLTDEVFILASGSAKLIVGADESLKTVEMEKEKVYNIKKDVWHHILVSRDAFVIIMENDDTSKENSEYKLV